jgi:hypothetical protein
MIGGLAGLVFRLCCEPNQTGELPSQSQLNSHLRKLSCLTTGSRTSSVYYYLLHGLAGLFHRSHSVITWTPKTFTKNDGALTRINER